MKRRGEKRRGVVNVALPRIGEDLDAGMSGLQWTVNAYPLTLASFTYRTAMTACAALLLVGAAADPRRAADDPA